ncbi:MAG: SMP-30/gluconolactonase/LRE family protein [Candidatus Xenobia bacterium]
MNIQRVTAPGATLQKLAGDFKFAEGLTCGSNGDVYFTDQPNDRIMKYSTEGHLSTFKAPAGRANGMTFDPQGNLIACADEHDELWSIKPDGQATVLAKGFEGKGFNGPNDVWCMPDQKLYFTDPFYDRTYWTHHQPLQDSEQVYLLAPGQSTPQRVTQDLVKPNGIVGAPDGKTLYVSDIGDDKTYAYDVNADGSLGQRRLACPKGSDGMTVDDHGNLYLSGNGVTVFDKDGHQIEHIDVPEKWVGNLCFGGKDKHTLFIAASEGLYAIRTQFAGANPAK